MKPLLRVLLLLSALAGAQLFPLIAGAQSITATPSTTDGTQAVLLKWSVPGATKCTASGGWNGARDANGQGQYAPKVTTDYLLVCPLSTGSLRAQWEAPTLDVEGKPIDGVLTYKVFAGPSATTMVLKATTTERDIRLTGLPMARTYVAVNTVNAQAEESGLTLAVSEMPMADKATLKATVTVIAPASTKPRLASNVVLSVP
jgi:hypothetical protein